MSEYESPFDKVEDFGLALNELRMNESESRFANDDAKEDARYDTIWAHNQRVFEEEQKQKRQREQERQRLEELYEERDW